MAACEPWLFAKTGTVDDFSQVTKTRKVLIIYRSLLQDVARRHFNYAYTYVYIRVYIYITGSSKCVKFVPKFTRKLYYTKRQNFSHIWKIQVLFKVQILCHYISRDVCKRKSFLVRKKKLCGVQNHTTTLHSTDRNGSYQQLQGILTSSINQSHSSQHPPPFDSFFFGNDFLVGGFNPSEKY